MEAINFLLRSTFFTTLRQGMYASMNCFILFISIRWIFITPTIVFGQMSFKTIGLGFSSQKGKRQRLTPALQLRNKLLPTFLQVYIFRLRIHLLSCTFNLSINCSNPALNYILFFSQRIAKRSESPLITV